MFLAALALSASLLTAAPAPAPAPAAAEVPQTQQAVMDFSALEGAVLSTSCSATQNCPGPRYNGVPVSCTGTTSCQVFTHSVSCDTTVVECTCDTAPPGCLNSVQYCDCRYYGYSHIKCATAC